MGSLGEGCIAVANTPGIWSDARHGGQSDGVLYVLFPRPGNLRPRITEQIQSEGEELLYRMIRMKERYSCAETAVADEQPMKKTHLPILHAADSSKPLLLRCF